MADVIREALEALLAENEEYIRINNIGGAYNNQVLQQARAALASPSGFAEGVAAAAKVCDRVAANAERRKAGHTSPDAILSAHDKMEIARECADRIRSLASPATERGSVVAWQSMETAPRGGPSYLVWCPDRMNTYVVVWRDYGWGEPGWHHFAEGNLPLRQTPTHWMPLPAPPERGDHLSGEGR